MQPLDTGSSQDRILYQIKRLGPRTAKELGELLEVTTMGARQHLAHLEAEGLVTTTAQETRGRGRPVRRWKLTASGHARFPDAHAQVTRDLLISVRDLLGEEALDTLIETRTTQTRADYHARLESCTSIEERVRALADIRTGEGYMAEVAELGGGRWRLVEHHCPICIAAAACQGFCRSELEVFQSLFPDADVKREDHLLNGARRCSYVIRPH